MAKCIMVQGTSSNAGKSILVAALARIYSRKGYKVAPFKSQNMSLNSYTTKEGGEIAIAQVLQAEACDIEPSIHMNPILLKPKGNLISQVIIQGKAVGDMNFYDYQHEYREKALKAIKESLSILKENYDLIIIEGAGSPAEINLRKEDLANMEIAHLSNSDVILVADIDRGGVFASIAGTFSLLDEKDRNRLKAVVINKFSGNLKILQPGIDDIEKIVNVPVLGVLPYDPSLHLPEEDSASLFEHKFKQDKEITIGVIRLPKIANFTDIDPFEFEEDVGINIIELNKKGQEEIEKVDAIIIPGTRSSADDMIELKNTGFDTKIKELSKKIPIVGICGGYQILGKKIIDNNKKESKHKEVNGLGLLDIETEFKEKEKIVKQSKGTISIDKERKIAKDSKLYQEVFKNIEGEEITGYELHEGTTNVKNTPTIINIKEGVGNSKETKTDGAIKGNVFGSYLHGIFHNYNLRNAFLNHIRRKKGLKEKNTPDPYEEKKGYSLDRLAEIVEENIDLKFIDKLIENNDKE